MQQEHLRNNESILVVARPPLATVWPKYLLTAGMYGLWHKRQVATVTNQRLLLGRGVLTRRENSIAFRDIRDAAYVRKGLSGYCELEVEKGTALRRTMRVGPLRARTARRIVEEVGARI